MRRRLTALVGLVVIGMTLSGCVAIKSVSGVQQEVAGPVRITLVVCAVDRAPSTHPGCDYPSNLGEPVAGSAQVLVALRVPDGTTAPQSVSGTTNDVSAPTLTLERDPSYESELGRLLPSAGNAWVGYRSSVYAYDPGANGTPAREVSISIDLTLPHAADGSPYVGLLPVVPVVGGRAVGAAIPGTRPVDCGTSAFTASSDSTVCVDSPAPASIGSAYSVSTRDFGIVAGNATASPGQTVSLPFGVRGAGALPAGLTASLTAATTLPGASATPSLPSAPLSNGSDTRVTVPVAIPADAAAGVYDVVLTGRLENGQERRGVAQLTVRARPAEPETDTTEPALSRVGIKPRTFRPATRRKPRRGANVSYSLSEAATVRVVVERCSRYAKPKRRKRSAKGRRAIAEDAARKRRKRARPPRRCVRFAAMKGAQAKAGRVGSNRFRFDGRVRGKALEPGPYRLALRPTDAAGNRGRVARLGFVVRR